MGLEKNALGGSWVPGFEGWGGSRHSTVTLPHRAGGEVGLVQRKLPLRWFLITSRLEGRVLQKCCRSHRHHWTPRWGASPGQDEVLWPG